MTDEELAQWLHDTHKNKSQNIGCYNFKLCKERDAWLLTARELQKKQSFLLDDLSKRITRCSRIQNGEKGRPIKIRLDICLKIIEEFKSHFSDMSPRIVRGINVQEASVASEDESSWRGVCENDVGKE